MAIKGSLLDRTKILPYWRTVCNYQTKTPSEPRDLSVAEPDYGGYWVGNGLIPRGVVHELIRWFSLQWKGIRSTWLGSGTPQSFNAVLETEKNRGLIEIYMFCLYSLLRRAGIHWKRTREKKPGKSICEMCAAKSLIRKIASEMEKKHRRHSKT